MGDKSLENATLMPASGAKSSPVADPSALTVAQLAGVLGWPVERVQEQIDAGVPVNPDGTINLVHYAAWMNRELARTDGD